MTVLNSGIYRIELGGDGWFYIGSAVNLVKRKREHRGNLKREKHGNIKMQAVWNKYNIFKFTVLEKCEIDNLLIREQVYLNQHFNDQKNVNIAPTAGSSLGRKHSAASRKKMCVPRSAEARKNMSIARKGIKVHTIESRAKMSAANKGKVRSAQQCANNSAAQKGKTLSAEHRAKISASLKGKIFSDKHRANLVAAWVLRYNKVYENC